jgi:hypothetical protein
MILRSIVILVTIAAGTAFVLDHPRLQHRVLHVISPVQLRGDVPWHLCLRHCGLGQAHLPRVRA